MTVVYGTAVNASGQKAKSVRVVATLNKGAVQGTQFISFAAETNTNALGYWSLDLVPNSQITTPNTYYVIRVNATRFFINVPASASPVAASTLIVSVPSNPLVNDTYVNSIAGLTGTITAEQIQAVAGAGSGGSGAVSSVDGQVGTVSLSGTYASIGHNHHGDYSPLDHTHHELSPVSHTHDVRYVQKGQEAVTSVAGLTGAVDLDEVYAAYDHTHVGGEAAPVTSVQGRTGAVTLTDLFAPTVHSHTGVYSPVSHNHNSTYSALSHIHDSRYVKIGEETVKSVNGQTGDVVISGGGGGGAVDSVDGRTGVVTLTDLYSASGHNHDSAYAATSHNHDSAYSAAGHTHSYPVTSVDGLTGAVSLSSSYSATGHTHSYAAVSHTHAYASDTHNHDSAYAASGHTHSYPVTSVDGLTGAVSLSSTYSASGHTHAGYATTSHNHDSAYSATGHTHSYPVTSVDGLTGAVSLSSVYSAAAHNHNSSYATLSHNHDASYATTGHTHSQFTAGAWTNVTMAASPVAGQIQYRSEPMYGIVRLKTTARIWASGGTVAAGSTLGTLPAGFRPATVSRSQRVGLSLFWVPLLILRPKLTVLSLTRPSRQRKGIPQWQNNMTFIYSMLRKATS